MLHSKQLSSTLRDQNELDLEDSAGAVPDTAQGGNYARRATCPGTFARVPAGCGAVAFDGCFPHDRWGHGRRIERHHADRADVSSADRVATHHRVDGEKISALTRAKGEEMKFALEFASFFAVVVLVFGSIVALLVASVWAAGEVGLKTSLWLFLGSTVVGGLVGGLWHGTISDGVGGALASGILSLVVLILAALVQKYRERNPASR